MCIFIIDVFSYVLGLGVMVVMVQHWKKLLDSTKKGRKKVDTWKLCVGWVARPEGK